MKGLAAKFLTGLLFILSFSLFGQAPGNGMFVAFNADGNHGFSFVTFVDVPNGTNVRFNDNEWNGSAIGSGGAFNAGESTGMTWQNNTGNIIYAGTVITITNVNTAAVASIGTISGTMTIDNANEVIYMFIGTNASTPTTFITAIGNDGFGANGTLTNTGLTAGLTATSITDDEDVMVYSGSINCTGTLTICATSIATAANWTTQDTGGDDSIGTPPNFPASVPCNFYGAAFGTVTYYSRNATSGGNWDSNTSWTTVSDGTGGPLATGVWPRRHDNVVIRSGHTITVDATSDNKSCGVSPDGLGQSNVGPFTSSNTAMFYHIGDITVSGTLTITGVEMMTGGYTHVLSGGTLGLGSNLVQVGYLDVDNGSTFTCLDDLVLTGNSVSFINTNSTSTDDLIIDHTNATLCGIGTNTLQNGSGSQITYTNSATINQICTSFTIACTGGGCTGFPQTGTTVSLLGIIGPGGVGNSSNIKMWYMGDRDAFSDAGTTPVANGGTVRQWNDQSGNNNHATQATAGNRPIYRTAQTNGLGALEFTGDLFIDGPTPGIAASSSHTYIMTYRDTQTGTGGVNDGSGHYILDRTTATNGLVSLKPISGNVYFYQKRDDGGGGLGGPSSTTLINTNTKWIEMVRNRGTNYRLYYNGVQESSVADGDGNTTPPNPRIGRHATTTNGGLRGFVNEFIVYSTTLTEIQRILINNYIAAKYALTLSANDVYTMDNSGNGDFDFQVAGIGQASDGSKHIDAKGPGIVRMWNPNNLTNGEYLLWGHNNGNLSGTTSGVDGTIIMQRLNRIWRVSETGDVGTTSISFDISSFAGVALGGNLRLLIDRDGDGFADNDVTPVSAGSLANNIITFSGISLQNGDRFTIGNTDLSTPLPVELISFTAQIEHGEVMLHWATASEKNNNYFTIQRSKNIEEWEDVVHVAGAGNSIEKREYTTSDGWPYEGVSYYRLKQTDFDGAFTYSSVRRVEIVSEEILRVYPNPTRSDFNLITGFDLNSNEISLINLMGQVVPFALEYESDRSVSIKPINPSTGVYLLRIRKGNYSRSVRVIIE